MTKISALTSLVALLVTISLAQESPTPTPSPNEIPSPSPVATESPSPTPTATAGAVTRSIPLRFVPPPMEGTVSLGIWDSNDKLVRVLQREAKIDSFTVEENSLSTAWDGKSDTGEDLPAGKYRARGYLVGKMKVEDLGTFTSLPQGTSDHISVKLVLNPLVADTRSVMDVAVGFDRNGSFLATMDGLPLFTVSETKVSHVNIKKTDEKTADIWQDWEQNEMGANLKHLRVSNIDKMMAFDCGFFQLK